MPKNLRSKSVKKTTSIEAKALVVLSGDARTIYEQSFEKWGKKLKPLKESIRASQCLSQEDFDIRINTRD